MLYDGGMFGAVLTAASGSIEASRSSNVLGGGVCCHVTAICSLTSDGTDGVETSPQKGSSDDQEQDAAG